MLLLAALPASYAAEGRLQASLLTCSPGQEVYELFGHEAIRIRGVDDKGSRIDTVWNYGVFDFAAPNFIYRFVKGETDYMVMPSPMQWFLYSYTQRGSGVTEQDLNLSEEETQKLWKLLEINSLPANRSYRYNYVRDNCATRIVEILEKAVAPKKIFFPDSVSYNSFRDAMRDFHKDYPWYQFGIDLVLGSGLDLPLSSREELFAPLLMEQKAAKAYFTDGTPLVKQTRILYPGAAFDPNFSAGERREYSYRAPTRPQPDALNLPALRVMGNTLPPTPPILSPMAAAIALLILSIGVGWWQMKHLRLAKWLYTVFFTLLGLAGCVVWFLIFFSSHEATSPNLLSLWLNPLQFVVGGLIWWRRTRPAAYAMVVVDIIIILVLTAIWSLQSQVANPAVFPLWGATLALSMSLVYVEARRRKNTSI